MLQVGAWFCPGMRDGAQTLAIALPLHHMFALTGALSSQQARYGRASDSPPPPTSVAGSASATHTAAAGTDFDTQLIGTPGRTSTVRVNLPFQASIVPDGYLEGSADFGFNAWLDTHAPGSPHCNRANCIASRALNLVFRNGQSLAAPLGRRQHGLGAACRWPAGGRQTTRSSGRVILRSGS